MTRDNAAMLLKFRGIGMTLMAKLAALAAICVAGAGTAQAQTAQDIYAQDVRGWSVTAVWEDNVFNHCYADRHNALRIAHNGSQWIIGVQNGGRTGWGVLGVDRFDLRVNYEGVEDGWVGTFIDLNWLDRIKRGNEVVFEVGGGRWAHGLGGSTAAVLKTQECAHNQGTPPHRMAPTPKPQQPSTSGYGGENDAYRMGAGCPTIGTVKSVGSSPTTVDFWIANSPNRGAVTIYWLDDHGNPVEMPLPDAQGHLQLNSTVGHHFIAKDQGGTCYGGVMTASYGGSVFHIN